MRTGSCRLLFSLCMKWEITNDAAEGKEKTDVDENSAGHCLSPVYSVRNLQLHFSLRSDGGSLLPLCQVIKVAITSSPSLMWITAHIWSLAHCEQVSLVTFGWSHNPFDSVALFPLVQQQKYPPCVYGVLQKVLKQTAPPECCNLSRI